MGHGMTYKWVGYTFMASGGTGYSTATRVVLKVELNDSSTLGYCYCNFNEDGNHASKKLSNKPSSTSGSQTDATPTISNLAEGNSLEIKVHTLTSEGGATAHRLTLMFETTTDVDDL